MGCSVQSTHAGNIQVSHKYRVRALNQSYKGPFGLSFKGEDLVSIAGVAEDDDISLYGTRRYISACMAIWRFFQFDTIQMAPSVKQLVIHLEGKQICWYEANEQDAQEALERHHNTELMDYFKTNNCPVCGEVARELKYEDMPSEFTWNKKNKVWQLQKNIEQIGRIVNIHPRSQED